MKRFECFFVILLLALTLAGCGKEEQETSGYRIYCVNEDGSSLEFEEYTPQAESGDALLQELIARLGEAPSQIGHKKAMPDGVGITSVVLTEKSLRVDFNGTYSEMDNITEVFCRAAVVKTLVQVPEVSTVEFTVNGQELADIQGNPIGVMSDDSFIDTKGDGINSYQYASLALYFADESGQKLVRETRSLHYSSNEALEHVVLEELIQGPESEALQAVVPADTKILDVTVNQKLCTVNLSEAFNKAAGGSVTPETAIYAIVNALCTNCGIEEVQFAIEGDSTVKFLDTVDISRPLQRNDSLVNPVDKDKTPGVGVDPALQNNK